ncbi:hypothetical protein CesoFtcFv8_022797 [Champsocephalus esox]|uniref:Uncharacterized protein n=1 Tax=Champsocephalus esox TaxID=159716 RepID=A0AAN8B7T8_9TELE|nr:hypothetical protein CesoFtcFv8_022797 [Champsocephalus esox]
MRAAGETTNTAPEDNQTEQEDNNKGWWWIIIVVIVAVAALTIIPVAAIRRKRTRGTDTQTGDNVADPEDGVSYASISYTRKSSRAHLHDDDEDDAVTYSTEAAEILPTCGGPFLSSHSEEQISADTDTLMCE